MADITLTRAEAEKIYELFNNIEAADSHYQRCQSDYFRLHVQGTYKNQAVAAAFDSLKRKLEAKETNVAENSPKRASKGVLS